MYFKFKLWIVQKLELANNKIRSMDGLQGHKYLEIIDLEENEVRYLLLLFLFYWILILILSIFIVTRHQLQL